MATLFEKSLLLYVCIAIACAFWQPNIVFGESKSVNVLSSVFNIDNIDNISNLGYGAESGISATSLQAKGTEGSNYFQSLVDGLANVLDFIMAIFRLVFSPFLIMVAGEFPTIILFIFIPIIVMMIVGIIQMIRGNG
jgi:hypothetical protein